MKIKFNWGNGIFTVIILFLLTVVGFFIYMSNLDINLVEDDYYEKELVYQEKIDKMKNTELLGEKIEVNADPGRVVLRFPSRVKQGKTSGTVLFYRPSDPKKDFSIPLQLDDSCYQVIETQHLDRGRWTLKLDWITDDKGYYYEEGIFIN